MAEIEWRSDFDIRGDFATHRDRVLRGLAEEQDGVVERDQLRAHGLGNDVIDRLVWTGRLVPLYSSVYAVGHRRLRPAGHRRAAVLAGGEGAVLSHRSAADAHGLLEDRRGRWDITVPPGRGKGRTHPRLILHRASLAAADVIAVDGVPCTSVSRSLLDIAGTGPRRHVERAVDQALVENLYDQWAIDEILRRPGRLRGVAVLRSVLEARHPDSHLTRSELERRALARLRAAGVPDPAVNVWLPAAGVEVDLLWKNERLAVELDGRRYHWFRTRKDRERDAMLRDTLGLRVLRYGWGDITAGPFPEEINRHLSHN